MLTLEDPGTAKTVKTHSNNLVVLDHVQLKPFYRLSTRDVTHVRKCTRPSPALPYCKRREAGWGPGNEASSLIVHACLISIVYVAVPGRIWYVCFLNFPILYVLHGVTNSWNRIYSLVPRPHQRGEGLVTFG